MFIYKGGQTVDGGTYYEPNKGLKIVLKDGDLLPGNTRERYFKLPESYILIPVLLIGLALSMAMPYGIGFVVFLGLIVFGGALYVAGSASLRLLKDMLSRTATFSYEPTTAYMTGKKARKAKKEDQVQEGLRALLGRQGSSDEEKKESR
jgi:hypothetical protein